MISVIFKRAYETKHNELGVSRRISQRMNSQKHVGISLVVILFIHLSAAAVSVSIQDLQAQSSFSVAQADMEYIQHFPISIERSEDFIGLGFEGEGTPENPYIIRNLNITVITGNCITIRNVPDYFMIRDCFLKSLSGFYSCIELESTNHSVIEQCYLEGGRNGINTYNTIGTKIDDCVCYDATYGISLSYSSMVEVANCRILRNSVGIRLIGADICNISSNKVYKNSDVGIDVRLDASQNLFSRNMIGWNRGVGNEYNAADYGSENSWIGNRWSDYDPPGPYQVEGWAVSNDTTALVLNDQIAPVVEEHEDVFFAEGTENMQIRWNASDSFPLYYEVTYQGEVIVTKTWAIPTVVFPLDNLGAGEYRFTLTTYDARSRASIDSVLVFVFTIIFADLGSPLLAIASLTSLVTVIAALVLFKYLQRGRGR